MDIIDELQGIISRLDEKGIEYALCGGLAMAIYAMPRATLDIDIMVEPKSIDELSKTVQDLGYTKSTPRLSFHNGKVIIYRFWKAAPGSGETLILDVLPVTKAIKSAWDGRRIVEWENGVISILSPKGLILMKSLRGSGQDKDDIEYLGSILDED